MVTNPEPQRTKKEEERERLVQLVAKNAQKKAKAQNKKKRKVKIIPCVVVHAGKIIGLENGGVIPHEVLLDKGRMMNNSDREAIAAYSQGAIYDHLIGSKTRQTTEMIHMEGIFVPEFMDEDKIRAAIEKAGKA